MTDTTSCYTALLEQIPPWLARVVDLSQQLGPRQLDLARAESERTGRTCSLSSAHSENERSPKRQRLQPESTPKPPSLSSSVSERPSQRLARMVVVFYDADFQTGMTDLVRDIGSARNNIRKCRMAARMAAMTAPTTKKQGSDGSDSDEDLLAKLQMQRRLRARGGGPPGGPEDAYDRADKQLEESQANFEKAAHQFLRDGSCKTLLDMATRRLRECMQLARLELNKASAQPNMKMANATKMPSTPSPTVKAAVEELANSRILNGTSTELKLNESFLGNGPVKRIAPSAAWDAPAIPHIA